MPAPKNLKKLEAATPDLIAKLKTFTGELTADERLVFGEIIESAAIHSRVVRAHDEGDPTLVFAKPKSVHSTVKMKNEFSKLSQTLGLAQKKMTTSKA